MRTLLTTLVCGIIFLTPYSAQAQSKEDVIKSFNTAFELAQGNKYMDAFNGFKETISLADQVGPEVNDIKTKAEGQLATLMFKHAGDVYKGGDVDAAIEAFSEAKAIAEQNGESSLAQKSGNVMMKLFNNMGTKQFKAEQYDAAIEMYDKALAINSNYDAAVFNKAEALNKQGKRNESIAELDKARQIGESTGRSSISRKATRKAAEYLIYWGTTAIEKENYTEAENYLSQAVIYDAENSDAYYRMAELANKRGNYDTAIDNANTALEFEKGSKTAKAKIYFELGLAYQFKGQKDSACDAFKNASFGSFKASAEHKIEHELKCGGAK